MVMLAGALNENHATHLFHNYQDFTENATDFLARDEFAVDVHGCASVLMAYMYAI
jgi:hypothetical protein